MYSQKIKKTIKQKVKNSFIVSLILAESIIMSCEKRNNIEEGKNLVQKEIKEEKESTIKFEGRDFSKINYSDNLYYNSKIQSFKADLENPLLIIYNSKTKKKYEINSDFLSKTLEYNGKIYVINIEKDLEIREYDINKLDENKLNTPEKKYSLKINSIKDNEFTLLWTIKLNKNILEISGMKQKFIKEEKDSKNENFSIIINLDEIISKSIPVKK